MATFKLPPGFRFHPTDVELMVYYLKRKVYGRELEYDVIAEVDLYKCEPWDLPEKSLITSSDSEWYFFNSPDKKYSNGFRSNRATEAGYWKATGKDRIVKTGKGKVGMKKTLVFYKGRAPHGERTNWVMHEYRLEEGDPQKVKIQDAYVLCRVFKKSGIGPKNPEQNSESLDLEEADHMTLATTFPDEKVSASELQAELSPADALTEEAANGESQLKTLGEFNTEPSMPGEPSDVLEPTETELRMLYALLWDSPNSMANGSTSELARLDSLSTIENPYSLRTDQDVDLWLEEPKVPDVINADATSSDQRYSAYVSLPVDTGILELPQSTRQLQELQATDLHFGDDCLESEYLLQKPASLNVISEYVHDLNEMNGDLSNMLEVNLLDVCQAPTSDTLNLSEEVPEEAVLEELLQLITEGQQSASTDAQMHGRSLTGGVEDIYFDVEDFDIEEMLEGPPWNEASTRQLQLGDALEANSSQIESWFNMPSGSTSNLSHVSQGLPDLSDSSLSIQMVHSSLKGQDQGQGEPQRDITHLISPSVDRDSIRGSITHDQHSSSKLSKPLSRFSKLLDSLPALPASAAEFPLHMRKQVFEPKDSPTIDSGIISKPARTAGCSITFRCSFEFLAAVWGSSSMEPSKEQFRESGKEDKGSTNPRVYGREVPKKRFTDPCFERCGNGCFSLVFFLGAMSAVCWFLILRMVWRLASYMGTLLM